MTIQKQWIIGGAVVVLGSFLLQQYVGARLDAALEKTSLSLTAHIAEQELVLTTIADLTRQNGADEITERIIVDCAASERQRFDTLLDKLSGTITRPELEELDTLFFKCGRFFADRKAVMAGRLVREVEVYRDYITLQTGVTGKTEEEQLARVSNWQQLADTELKLAEDFNKLVELQGDIINTLLAGKERTSPEISATLEAVSGTRNNMTVLNKQIENLRSNLRTI